MEAGTLTAAAPTDLTINELCLKFWEWAEGYYPAPSGGGSAELHNIKYGLRVLRELYGHAPAAEFGPLAFKKVRDAMVAKGWSRPFVNKQAGYVKRVVRWAVENELLPADRWEALRAVRGLAKGRTAAREPDPVRPAPVGVVRAVLPFVRSPVRGMIEIHLLTGMRPAEVCRIRPCDVDASGDVWVYRPAKHKNEHRGKGRAVALGARAQEVLKQFTPDDPTAYFFTPTSATAERNAERAAGRQTPRYPSHMSRNEAKRVDSPKRPPGRCYTAHSYTVAVYRACDRAFPPPGDLVQREGETRAKWWARLTPAQRAEVKAWQKAHRWHPNQIRHTFATTIRERFGLEAAQVLLGHEKANTTEIYAERNMALAVRVAAEIG